MKKFFNNIIPKSTNPKYLDPAYINVSEMQSHERNFLYQEIKSKKPSKILEIGVSSGSSSVLILNTIKNIRNAKCYSIDYLNNCYYDCNKKTGFIVDQYPELKSKWKLYTGGLTSKFIEEIGNNIDFCFIDAAHRHPGEILDFLIILPFLKNNCTIVLHDIALYQFEKKVEHCICNGALFSAVTGNKQTTKEYDPAYYFSNIGSFTINKNTRKNIKDIFRILSFPWSYMPTDEDLQSAKSIIKKYYNSDLNDYFDRIIDFQKKRISIGEHYE